MMLLKTDLAVGDLSMFRVLPLPIISHFIQGFLKTTTESQLKLLQEKKVIH